MPRKRVTIEDVAREAKVSITTVSRFLNERYEAMSEKTKQRIDSVIRELNYQPNALAQGLKGNRSRMIAVIVVNIGYPFCVSLIRALSAVLTPAGYNLVVCETGGEKDRELKILESMLGQRMDAIVIQTNGDNNTELARIAKTLPVVLVDRKFPVSHATNVLTNNFDASLEMVAHLFCQGYESVLYVTEEADSIHTRQERLRGYLEGCQNHGRTPYVSYVSRGEPATFESAAAALAERRGDGPVAVYTANALVLHELYPSLRRLNLKVPQELGIATFDEPDWIDLVSPTLTCIRQPVLSMGQWIGSSLIEQLKDEHKPAKEERVQILDSELVPGDSTRLTPTGITDGTR